MQQTTTLRVRLDAELASALALAARLRNTTISGALRDSARAYVESVATTHDAARGEGGAATTHRPEATAGVPD